MSRPTLVRGRVLHAPGDRGVLESNENGAVVFADDGEILATGDYAAVSADHPEAEVLDERDAFLLPGLVDTHVHWPQLGVIGAMGLELLEWLRTRTLPEEARLADPGYARALADDFLRGLAANGTTTALVFGSHFRDAQHAFFEAADRSGLRITSGLVVSDRDLLPALRTTPGDAHAAGRALASSWHGRGRLRYAVTPRFALSCSDELLESCGALAAELGDSAWVTTHLNENRAEIEAVLDWFPGSPDYLAAYERHALAGPRSVFAHNVHATDDELGRMAGAGCSVAHCPSSNGFLGSGLFPMTRHLARGVRIALGTDVGAGAGLSLLGEALAAYQAQMVAPDGVRLSAADLLWLATRAGAEALGLADAVGDLTAGKQADLMLLKPPSGGTLEAALARSESVEHALGTLITLAREDCVRTVWVGGKRVHDRR